MDDSWDLLMGSKISFIWCLSLWVGISGILWLSVLFSTFGLGCLLYILIICTFSLKFNDLSVFEPAWPPQSGNCSH